MAARLSDLCSKTAEGCCVLSYFLHLHDMSITHVFPKAHLILFSAAAVAAALLCRVHVVSISSAADCCRFITPSGKIHSVLPRMIVHCALSGGC